MSAPAAGSQSVAAVSANRETQVVPFGKYKGRPVAELVADRSYVAAVALLAVRGGTTITDADRKVFAQYRCDQRAQAVREIALLVDWLSDKKTAARAADTLERVSWAKQKSTWDGGKEFAALQKPGKSHPVTFSYDYRGALCINDGCKDNYNDSAATRESAELLLAERRQIVAAIDELREPALRVLCKASRIAFECDGYDCCYHITTESVAVVAGKECKAPLAVLARRNPHAPYDSYDGSRFGIEAKPVIGDEYTAVLRQVCAASAVDQRVVVAGAYTGVGATLEQVRAIFKSRDVALLLVADIEAAMAR